MCIVVFLLVVLIPSIVNSSLNISSIDTLYTFVRSPQSYYSSYALGEISINEDGKSLYGKDTYGGKVHQGSLWRYSLDRNQFNIMFDFSDVCTSANICFPFTPVLYGNEVLYGATGGRNNVIYSYNINGNQFNIECSMKGFASSDLFLASTGFLYHTTKDSLMQFNPQTKDYISVANFNNNYTNGGNLDLNLIEYNNHLYGIVSFIGFSEPYYTTGFLFTYSLIDNLFYYIVNFFNNNNIRYFPQYLSLTKSVSGEPILFGTSIQGGEFNNGTTFGYNILNQTSQYSCSLPENSFSAYAGFFDLSNPSLYYSFSDTGGLNNQNSAYFYQYNLESNQFAASDLSQFNFPCNVTLGPILRVGTSLYGIGHPNSQNTNLANPEFLYRINLNANEDQTNHSITNISKQPEIVVS